MVTEDDDKVVIMIYKIYCVIGIKGCPDSFGFQNNRILCLQLAHSFDKKVKMYQKEKKIDISAMYLKGKAKFQCIADKNLLLGINKSGLPSTLRECLGTEPREDSKRRTLK